MYKKFRTANHNIVYCVVTLEEKSDEPDDGL
jgi:hypothetical protein